ncbi:MAG: transposase [Clostridia bacterium]|nr:transposase [Clostridia bacterium]
MEISNESYKYILARVLERAFESIEEANENEDEFYKGRKLAYYEIADIIKSELMVRDADLKEFGLDVDLEKAFL